MVNSSWCSLQPNSWTQREAEPVAIRRILVVEDEVNLRTIVCTCLEALGGWEVEVAASGQEGLMMAERDRPDVILLDAMMPGMDGVTFLRKLLANPQLQAIPVIFLTAKQDLLEPQTFLKLGAKGAIAKPFNPLTLHKEIAAVLC